MTEVALPSERQHGVLQRKWFKPKHLAPTGTSLTMPASDPFAIYED